MLASPISTCMTLPRGSDSSRSSSSGVCTYLRCTEAAKPGIDTVPLTNLAGWLLAGLVLMTLLDLLVARTALAPRTGDGAPLLVLGWMTLGGAVAHAGWLGLPGSAAWGVLLAVPVLVALAVQTRRP